MKAIAPGFESVEVECLEHLAAIGPIATGGVIDTDAQYQPRVRIGRLGQHAPSPWPVAYRPAAHISGPDGQIGARLNSLQQSVQLFGSVATIGVHLD
ncbi:hypothetical protein A3649_19415 [Mycobacterium ulcerans]|nr:hypothetical protein A3649_19415 [Mycobacterium ulcerans]